jgi:hypothetical protein
MIIERIDSLVEQSSIFLTQINSRTYPDVVELAKWKYLTISLIEKIPLSNTIKTEILELFRQFDMLAPDTTTLQIIKGYLEGIKDDLLYYGDID